MNLSDNREEESDILITVEKILKKTLARNEFEDIDTKKVISFRTGQS